MTEQAEVLEEETDVLETEQHLEQDNDTHSDTAPDDGTEQKGDFIPEEQIAERTKARIDRLTAEKFAERRKREELEARLRQLEETKQQPAPVEKPTLEQFEYDQDAYEDALLDWKLEQRLKTREVKQRESETQAQMRARDEAFDKKEVEYVTQNPSYAEDVQQLPIFKSETLNILRGLENGPQVVHHLAKNPELAYRIADSDPYTAAIEIGKLTASISKPKPQTKTSSAPEPIDPIKPGSGLSNTDSVYVQGATFE